jgi:hypothetical protein
VNATVVEIGNEVKRVIAAKIAAIHIALQQICAACVELSSAVARTQAGICEFECCATCPHVVNGTPSRAITIRFTSMQPVRARKAFPR